jgi:hypothetical protein
MQNAISDIYSFSAEVRQKEETKVSWLIEGTMQNGRTLRPSDWVERISGVMAQFGADHRLRYGAARPCFVAGKKCLLVKKSLQRENPAAFEYISSFVRSNGLQMCDVSTEKSAPAEMATELEAVA